MAGFPSDVTPWGAGQILGSFFGNYYNPPATLYLALLCAPVDPQAGEDASLLVEPPEEYNYQRLAITNDSTFWSDPADTGIISNVVEISWTATQTWPQGVIGYAFCDAPTAGNMFCWGNLTNTTGVLVEANHSISFAVGQLIFAVSSMSLVVPT